MALFDEARRQLSAAMTSGPTGAAAPRVVQLGGWVMSGSGGDDGDGDGTSLINAFMHGKAALRMSPRPYTLPAYPTVINALPCCHNRRPGRLQVPTRVRRML